MTIGQNIKKYRKEAGLTQETLAERLGLTPSAVSQWETDRVMPDITQLPLLCNAFDVTADELLGIDTKTKERLIEEIVDKADTLCVNKEWGKACDILRKALEDYPDSCDIMISLATALVNVNFPDTKDTTRLERIKLYEKVLESSDNNYHVNLAVAELCGLYAKDGRVEDAKALLKHIPTPIYSYKQCLLISLGGTMEWVDEACLQINEHFHEMMQLMCQVGVYVEYAICDEEILKVWEKVEDIAKIFYENGDYQLSHCYFIEKHFWIAQRYVKLARYSEAIESLEKMMDHIEKYEQYRERCENGEDFQHISVLSRKISDQHEKFMTGYCSAYFYFLKLKDKSFDPIRKEERFANIELKLREIVGEE